MAMTRTQRLLTGLVPRAWAAAMEADSRRWMVRCHACGFARSIWEIGGVRWKATGSSATWRRCPGCGARGRHTIERRDEAPPAGGV